MDQISEHPDDSSNGEGDSPAVVPALLVRPAALYRPASNPAPAPAHPRRPSIRIQRWPSTLSIHGQDSGSNNAVTNPESDADHGTRRRSSSEPQRLQAAVILDTSAPRQVRDTYMSPLAEEASNPEPAAPQTLVPLAEPDGRLRRLSASARSAFGLYRAATTGDTQPAPADEYETQIVDLLDVVDPEVSTLTTLTNVQNSLFVPALGNFVNRRPTYVLTRRTTQGSEGDTSETEEEPEKPEPESRPAPERSQTRTTITSTLGGGCFAVIPDGASLEGWSKEDKRELNDHVRHMLHSRRAKFKRGLKGFGQYVRRPLGFLVTLYATLITLFGLAWVLFLIGWINVGGRQIYIINVIDNILVALFAILGDGLAPFRTVDTYHMIFIAHYHRLTWRLRREQDLPKLQNKNDLPLKREKDADVEGEADLEGDVEEAEYSVLTPQQQKRLVHHQRKFANSHTFYKPHETGTHYAFPLRLLVAIVVLLDCHSLFQIALGSCTWAINYHHRPFVLTTVILCCSICCNITAGILIYVGDRKTRKKEVVEKMFRQELTEEAMAKVQKKKRKREEKEE